MPLQSVASNLFLGREPRTRFGLVDFREMHRRARDLLGSYGIDVDVTRPLRTLGMGVQQMVAVARAADTKARVVILDEPTSSLEAREVDTLFGIIGRLRADGVAVLYVSHRLDELYRICDRVTVLRDGRLVHSGPMAELPRLRLVAMMLGRDLEEVRRDGATRFDGERTAADEPPVLDAIGLTAKHRLDGVDVTVRPGEIVGLGGLLGAGRSETAMAIAGALPLDSGMVMVAGKRLRTGSVGAAMRAGVVLLPEDRKADGILPELSVRENIVLAALPRLSAAGVVSRGGRTPSSRRSCGGCGSRRRARTSGSASCPAATSRRCCWPGCCARGRRCCCSTSRPAASTSARRRRCRRWSTSWPRTGWAWC